MILSLWIERSAAGPLRDDRNTLRDRRNTISACVGADPVIQEFLRQISPRVIGSIGSFCWDRAAANKPYSGYKTLVDVLRASSISIENGSQAKARARLEAARKLWNWAFHDDAVSRALHAPYHPAQGLTAEGLEMGSETALFSFFAPVAPRRELPPELGRHRNHSKDERDSAD